MPQSTSATPRTSNRSTNWSARRRSRRLDNLDACVVLSVIYFIQHSLVFHTMTSIVHGLTCLSQAWELSFPTLNSM